MAQCVNTHSYSYVHTHSHTHTRARKNAAVVLVGGALMSPL